VFRAALSFTEKKQMHLNQIYERASMFKSKARLGILLTAMASLPVVVTSADSGWFWQNPQGNTLYSVTVVDAHIALAVGQAGTILKTTDGGVTRTPQSSGTANDLLGVSFSDAHTDTAVGGGGIILGDNSYLRIRFPRPGSNA
jgi:hypothetical protein